jgi:hypothetical protein
MLASEAREEGAIGLAAAQEDVLAVVHLQPVAVERVGRPAKPAPDLDEGHAGAGGGAVERRRDSREAPADDENAAL